jgi:hypothetical protein
MRHRILLKEGLNKTGDVGFVATTKYSGVVFIKASRIPACYSQTIWKGLP